MKTKLIAVAILTALSTQVHAEVYKCGNTYQQSPCAGQVDTAQPMKVVTKDTGNGGIRESEQSMIDDIRNREIAAAEARKKALEEEQKKLEEERRHKEMVDATIVAGALANPKHRVNPNVLYGNSTGVRLTPIK